ncbi:CotH kinase family protein [Defluviitalea phaphyphila]|uniref:CotH kinase family protein n=1 Tax=Defluviitalea phaphyphila TaxID=1473580 RepID=UPI0007303785|nr:CotH kinase family protein [Defluviitalea phaphyphila]
MIKEKYIGPISIILIIITTIIVTGIYIFTPSNLSNNTEIDQPDYINKVFDKDQVTQINIEIDEENWNWLLENAAQEEYVVADITINGETFNNVGIRAKGNSSLNMVESDPTTDRYSFKIDFDQYIEGQTLYGLEKLALNNMIQDTTYMKEYISYSMFEEMEIPTPAYAFANITINGEPWGLYLAVETIEESFLERYYGSIDGNLYKPEGGQDRNQGGGDMPPRQNFNLNNNNENLNEMPQPPNMEIAEDINVRDPVRRNEIRNPIEDENLVGDEVRDPIENGIIDNDARPMEENIIPGNSENRTSSGGTNLVYIDDDLSSYENIFNNAVLKTTNESDYQKVVDMIRNLNEGTNLEEYIDVDEVLRYFAVNTFLVNLDSYASSMKHNYYLYEENGRFQILPWDFNLAFAGFQVEDAKTAINFPIDTPVVDSMENSPLISKLLEVDEYKEKYHQYLSDIVINYIESGKYENTINQLNELIKDYVKNDATAFYSYEEYTSSLSHLIQFGKDRAKSIIAQLSGEQPSTTYGDIDTTVDLSKLGGTGGKGGGKPNRTNNRGEGLDNSQDMPNMNRGPQTSPRNNQLNLNFTPTYNLEILITLISVIVLVIGLVFALKFKKKKYTSK